MAGAVERFRRAAEAQGLTPDIQTFPEGTKTADAAARAVGCDVAQIVKSLVFVVDGRPLVALTSGANRADPARLAALEGAGAVLAHESAEDVLQELLLVAGEELPDLLRDDLPVVRDFLSARVVPAEADQLERVRRTVPFQQFVRHRSQAP